MGPLTEARLDHALAAVAVDDAEADCPGDGDYRNRNRGEYVSCETTTVKAAVSEGLLVNKEGASIKRSAARSTTGE